MCQAEHAQRAGLLPSGTGPQGPSAGRRRSAEHTRTRTLNPSRTRTHGTLNTHRFLPADRPRRQAQSQSRKAYYLLREVPRGRFSASQRGADYVPSPRGGFIAIARSGPKRQTLDAEPILTHRPHVNTHCEHTRPEPRTHTRTRTSARRRKPKTLSAEPILTEIPVLTTAGKGADFLPLGADFLP